MHGGNWGVFLDEDGMLVLSPVSRLRVVFRGRRTRMFADYDGVVIHGRKRGSSADSTRTFAESPARFDLASGQKKFE